MSLQAEINEREAAAANDDASWRMEARETAARIANDVQALMAQAEEMFLQWAADGLLDRSNRVAAFDHSVGRHVMIDLPRRSALEASARYASMVREVAMDALSVSAREAVDAQ
jgi:hypothetical protein